MRSTAFSTAGWSHVALKSFNGLNKHEYESRNTNVKHYNLHFFIIGMKINTLKQVLCLSKDLKIGDNSSL